MSGTIVCGVTDSPEGRAAAQLAGALSARLGLRLVLAHVVDPPPAGHDGEGARRRFGGAQHALEAIAREHDLAAELCVVVGQRAQRLAEVAADEGADLIVLGSRPRGLRGGRITCSLARELEAATPTPVLVAPPQTRRRSERRLALAQAAAGRP